MIGRSTKKSVALVVAFWLAFFVLANPGGEASAISYGGIGGRPAFPRADNLRTSDIFVQTIAPGQSQAEGVIVINNSPATKTLMVYSADATPSTDGGFACKQLAESKEQAGTWIVFGQPGQETVAALDRKNIKPTADNDKDGLTNEQEWQHGTNIDQADTDNDGVSDKDEIAAATDPLQPVVVVLAPATNVLIPFEITVPANADTGEHNGCVLIQEKKELTGQETGMVISTRTGIRVAVTVPGEIIRRLTIVGLDALPRQAGGKIIKPAVKNVGNTSVDAVVNVSVKSIFGRMIKELGGQYAILRGETSSWNYELPPSFWGGVYRPVLKVSYNADPQATTGVDTDTAKTILVLPGKWFLLLPSVAAVIIYGLILLFVIASIILWQWYRRRQKLIQTTWVLYKVKPGDDVKSLAKRGAVSWRLLVRVNRIVPPYLLKPETVIKMPPYKEDTSSKPPVNKKEEVKKKSPKPRPKTAVKKEQSKNRQ